MCVPFRSLLEISTLESQLTFFPIADHVEHFRCAHNSCGVALLDHHFVVGKLPYCERHEASAEAAVAAAADKVSSSRPSRGGPPVVRSTTRSKKRQTIITKR